MSRPRPILPGRIYLITRRCSQRQFLLRPDERTNEAFHYCLGEAASRFGMELVGWLAMSNHYHAIVHDPLGRLPDFTCHFHQMLAKVLNARWSRWENLWSTEPPTYTELVDPSDVLDKLVYTLTNPVAAHLVETAAIWPGASSFGLPEGREIVVKRPKTFFRDNGVMPQTVRLIVTVPARVRSSIIDWAERLAAAVEKRERSLREHRLANRIRLVGRKAVRSASAFDFPTTASPRLGLRPLVASKDIDRRREALEGLKAFWVAHQDARERFIQGVRDVVFPRGTFALRRLGVVCQGPPSQPTARDNQ